MWVEKGVVDVDNVKVYSIIDEVVMVGGMPHFWHRT